MKTLAAISLTLFTVVARGAYDSKHALWNQLVSARVKDGVVDYQGLKADSAKLDQYVAQVGEVTAEEYGKWGREDQMAYLINAYNAFTARLITDFYPVDSIRDIGGKVGGGLFNKKSKQWKVSEYQVGDRKVVFRAMGKPVTLDEIEHENLRPIFKDARVHFALVCGAVSCPFLRSEAYVAARLNEQLDAQGKQFLADPFRNRYDGTKNTLYLSKIFDWFSGDFKKDGDVYSFVKKYLPETVVAQIKDKPEIEYLEYDWSLNSRAGKLN
jgi:hypothetical protein